jgi:hypothetical protein
MGALAHPIGIRVEDETALEDWLDEIAQRVMDDAITKQSPPFFKPRRRSLPAGKPPRSSGNWKSVETTNRNPILSLRLFGLLLLR